MRAMSHSYYGQSSLDQEDHLQTILADFARCAKKAGLESNVHKTKNKMWARFNSYNKSIMLGELVDKVL
jgi:hypothetical protein